MRLTYSQLMAAGLSLSQARRVVRTPFGLPNEPIHRASGGRREASYAFSDLAPRLSDFGLSPESIAALALTSISNSKSQGPHNE